MTNDQTIGNDTRWRFTYWFPSKDDTKEVKLEYMMRGQRPGHTLVLQSEPDNRQAYMLVRLRIDGQVASGSWHETAEIDGEFSQTEYSGAGQMIISENGEKMSGLWAGAGFDHDLGKLRMYTNKWELVLMTNTNDDLDKSGDVKEGKT